MNDMADTPTPEPIDTADSEVSDLELPDKTAPPATTPEIGFEHTPSGLKLRLPEHLDWVDLWPQLQIRLQGQDSLWSGVVAVECHCGERLMDQSQLQQLAEALSEQRLQLVQVITGRRQTAIAAATLGYSVQQNQPLLPPLVETAEGSVSALYLKTTLRSGMEICHGASVIVVGDVHAGASIIAAGDIIVWGRLRGVAHAGAKGNAQARIMTLEMAATQLRIAEWVARTPEPPNPPYPEVAYATEQGIQIAPALHLLRYSTPRLEAF